MFHGPKLPYFTHTFSFAEITANWSMEQTHGAPTAYAPARVSGTETRRWTHSVALATTTAKGTGNPDPSARGQYDGYSSFLDPSSQSSPYSHPLSRVKTLC